MFLEVCAPSAMLFARSYGDSLLRTMTFKILAELYGSGTNSIIKKILPYAVSNAFYENIILQYGLDKLCIPKEDTPRPTKATTHSRGDILESYMAAVEMDASRSGQGYQEIYDWLSDVIATRLRGVSRNHLNSLLSKESPAGNFQWNKYMPLSQIPYRLTNTISRDHQSPVRHLNSVSKSQLQLFRKASFEKMSEILMRIRQTVTSTRKFQLEAFWIALKSWFDGLYDSRAQCKEVQILVHYYRVPSTNICLMHLVLCESPASGL